MSLPPPSPSPSGLQTLRQSLFLISMPLFFVTFALPVQSKALGASALEIGGLFSLFSLSILLMRPVIGYGIDQFGRRIFLLIATLFYIGAYMGYALADGIQSMYVARFFQGLGAALMLISVDTITADLAPAEERTQAMGSNVEIQARASVVGAVIGFTLVGAVPQSAWTYSFGVFAVLAMLAFLLVFLRLPDTRRTSVQNESSTFEFSPDLQKLLLLFVLLGTANSLMMPMYLVYLQDNFTADPRTLSWAFLPSALIFMVLPSRMGALVDKGNPRALIKAAMVFSGCFYLAMTIAPGFWWMVLLYSLSVVGSALVEPTRKSLTAGMATPDTYGKTFGFAEMAFGIGAIFGPLIGGYLYDSVSHTMPFAFNGMLMFVSAMLSVWLLRQTSKDKHCPPHGGT